MEQKALVCANLMRVGKSFPGLLEDIEGDERAGSSQYICVKTANAVGPDNNVATPLDCNGSRPCFQES